MGGGWNFFQNYLVGGYLINGNRWWNFQKSGI